VRDFLVEKRLQDNYDLVTVPGASLGINKVVEAVATSIRLHEPGDIYIFDHEDCGAYGENNSVKAHVNNLKKAKELLAKPYPDKKVLTYIVGFDKIEEIP
jgi:hypothetical protein